MSESLYADLFRTYKGSKLFVSDSDHRRWIKRTAFRNYNQELVDDTIRSQNPYLKTAFSFVYQEKNYCIYRGKLTYAEPNRIYIKVKRIPMDPKHKTKLNYKKVIDDYILKKRVI